MGLGNEHTPTATQESLVDELIIAKLLGTSVKFVQEDRATKRHGIPYYRVGRRRMYKISEVLQWLETQSVRQEPERDRGNS